MKSLNSILKTFRKTHRQLQNLIDTNDYMVESNERRINELSDVNMELHRESHQAEAIQKKIATFLPE